MIKSLHITPTHLFSLTNTPTLSVYSLSDFAPISKNQPFPKLESSLGICLKKPNAVFDVSFVSGEVKFAEKKESNNFEREFFVVYDRQNVVGLDQEALMLEKVPELEVTFHLNAKQLQLNTQEKGSEITSVLLFDDQLKNHPMILVCTRNGKLHLFGLTQNKSLQLINSTSLQQLSSPLSQIITEDEEQSLKLILSQSNQQNCDYVQTTGFDNNQVYLATIKGKLLTVSRENLEMRAMFESGETLNGVKGTSSFGQPTKIVFVRNSVLVLYSRAIMEFNAYTHTITNTILLPFSTLDLSIMQSPRTLSSSLLLIGQCNLLYSMDFPLHSSNTQNPQDSVTIKTRSVSISSRLGKCIKARSNMVFVGGSDGTIDVLVNGEMMLAVLVQDE